MLELAIKIDVDTERGTRIGVPDLLKLFEEFKIQTTFLFSLGPDNTGRAIKRIFRPGFFQKVSRTNIIELYGLKTLTNGILRKGPHIGKCHGDIMRQTKAQGHEVGIHCYDHIRWQDGLSKMTEAETRIEVTKACNAFKEVFSQPAQTMGAAGWQANRNSLTAYDDSGFLYASDARGTSPFFPKSGNKTFKTLQIPTTLPTLDELIGRPEYPLDSLADHYLSLIKLNALNTLTIHAELEGMSYLAWFRSFLEKAVANKVSFVTVESIAKKALMNKNKIISAQLIQGSVDGRSGTLAVQGDVINF